jgi:hypothetical protein
LHLAIEGFENGFQTIFSNFDHHGWDQMFS